MNRHQTQRRHEPPLGEGVKSPLLRIVNFVLVPCRPADRAEEHGHHTVFARSRMGLATFAIDQHATTVKAATDNFRWVRLTGDKLTHVRADSEGRPPRGARQR